MENYVPVYEKFLAGITGATRAGAVKRHRRGNFRWILRNYREPCT